MKTKTSIEALIKLMGDPEEKVAKHAKSTLLSYGEEIILDIEQLEETSFTYPEYRENILIILHELRFQKIKRALQDWKDSKEKDLLDAVYLVSTYQFPQLQKQEFISQIGKIQHKCWLKLNSRQTSFEKVSKLNEVFFKELDFIPIDKLPHSPFDVFVNAVLDTREGAGLSLGLLYSIVAQSLDIPIYGVTTMNNRAPFVLAYLDKNHLLPLLNWEIENNGVLFYIGVGSKGRIVEPQRLKLAYQEEGLPQDRSQFEPSPNSLLVKKYLMDIYRSYANQPQFRYKLVDLEELIELMS